MLGNYVDLSGRIDKKQSNLESYRRSGEILQSEVASGKFVASHRFDSVASVDFSFFRCLSAAFPCQLTQLAGEGDRRWLFL